jgi:hypothetical protein
MTQTSAVPSTAKQVITASLLTSESAMADAESACLEEDSVDSRYVHL